MSNQDPNFEGTENLTDVINLSAEEIKEFQKKFGDAARTVEGNHAVAVYNAMREIKAMDRDEAKQIYQQDMKPALNALKDGNPTYHPKDETDTPSAPVKGSVTKNEF